MKIQIRLNSENPRDKALIDYLIQQGRRNGIPKQLLLSGFESGAIAPPAPIKQIAVEDTPAPVKRARGLNLKDISGAGGLGSVNNG